MLQATGFDGIFIGNPSMSELRAYEDRFFYKVMETNDGGAAPLDPGKFAEFACRVKMDLALIASKPIGADLLRLIGLRHGGTGIEAGHKVYIAPKLSYVRAKSKRLGFASKHLGFQTSSAPDAMRRGRLGDHIRLAGKGHSSVVRYINRALDPKIDVKKTTQTGVTTPAWISLAHELIHAFHDISGNKYTDRVDGVQREELYTTGLGPYANTRISEAAIRKEHGFPLRTHYYSRLRDAKIVAIDCAWAERSWGGSAYRVQD
jgi:hypothetical protein